MLKATTIGMGYKHKTRFQTGVKQFQGIFVSESLFRERVLHQIHLLLSAMEPKQVDLGT